METETSDCETCASLITTSLVFGGLIAVYATFLITEFLTNHNFTKKHERENDVRNRAKQKTFKELVRENLLLKQKISVL